MTQGTGDMTATDESKFTPNKDDNPQGDREEAIPPDDGTMIPLPDEMKAEFSVGDTFSGTVVDRDGALYIQIQASGEEDGFGGRRHRGGAVPYTGKASGDSDLNTEEALDKYMSGMKGNRATQ